MIRFPAEWEGCSAVLLALPEADTDWAYMLDQACDCYRSLVEALVTNGEHVLLMVRDEAVARLRMPAHENIRYIQTRYNDTWTRDYGPITVWKDDELRALDFGFNGWGLKFASDLDNLAVSTLHREHELFRDAGSYGRYRKELDFVLEGGSVESDGRGTILTTSRCLCSPCRNGGLTKAEATEQLRRRLGADHVLWLDYGALAGDDTDSHIDTLARLAPDNSIIFVGCRDVDDEHFEEMLKMRAQLTLLRNAEGLPYNLIELPMAPKLYDENGQRLPTTYANYLVTSKNLFMPVYGDNVLDRQACQIVRIAFPGHKVIPVDCRALVQQHGSLHCATMQLLK